MLRRENDIFKNCYCEFETCKFVIKFLKMFFLLVSHFFVILRNLYFSQLFHITNTRKIQFKKKETRKNIFFHIFMIIQYCSFKFYFS